MNTITDIKQLRDVVRAWKLEGLNVGLVPTMGNLHVGHLSLVTEAHQHCDKVVATVFVNPMQFGPNEDFDSYPRTLEADAKKLAASGCDVLFAPSVAVMYPSGLDGITTVSVPEITANHCGAARPGHFDGVTTVVNKLFNLVQPDVAVFGKKDYQQWRVIEKMVLDTCSPIKIIGKETAREDSGLALSSRNQYLTAAERDRAVILRQSLLAAAEQLKTAENTAKVSSQVSDKLTSAGFTVDYINICRQSDLEPANDSDNEVVILAAAFLGKARLIDNIEVNR